MKKGFLKVISALLITGMAVTMIQPATVYAANPKTDIIQSDVLRVYGKTRYDTSFSIADQLKKAQSVERFDTVIIASGKNFPDALAGSYLAAKKDAPILMTDGNPESSNTKDLYEYVEKYVIKEDLSEKNPDIDIYILGGTGAVPEEIEEELIARGYSAKRLSGKDRYLTNLAILNEAGVDDEEILVCTGQNFADSLSASATGLPILLVNPNSKVHKLTTEQEAFLKKANNQITIIGGKGAVSAEYEAAVKVYDFDGEVERISGANRYATSVEVAKRYCKNALEAVAAYAENFPDGLCGGPLAYTIGAPLILTKTGKEAEAAKYTAEKGIYEGIVLGGDSLISNDAAKKIFALANKNNGTADKINTQMYTVRVSTTLHSQPGTGTTYVEVPYMSEVTYLGIVSNSNNGSWVKVSYEGKIYYLWQAAGTEYLTEIKSDFKYEASIELQQAVIDTALNIFFNWDTKYAHNQSTGEKDVDGKYGFDCSGFAAYVLDTVMQGSVPTYNLSADIEELYKTSSVYNKGLNGEFKVITVRSGTLKESELQPGDVLFFNVGIEENQKNLPYNHCGIYLGDGEFIHCTRSWGGGVCIMPFTGIYADGFVAAKRYLPDSITTADAIRYTNSQKTCVYESQDSDKDPIVILPAECQVTVLFTDNGNWSYVSYGANKTGFILTKYLDEQLSEVSEKMYVQEAELKLYESYSTNSSYVTITFGTEVEFKGRYSNSSYYKVAYDGDIYYVYAPNGIESRLSTDLDTLLAGCGSIEILKNTNLRTSMTDKTQDNIICMMYAGEQAVLLTQSSSGTWSYIQLDNGTSGYILTKYINITKK